MNTLVSPIESSMPTLTATESEKVLSAVIDVKRTSSCVRPESPPQTAVTSVRSSHTTSEAIYTIVLPMESSMPTVSPRFLGRRSLANCTRDLHWLCAMQIVTMALCGLSTRLPVRLGDC